MKLKNSGVKVALLILSMLVWTTVNRAQAAVVREHDTTIEYEKSQDVAEEFCQAWRNKDYPAMYQLLSQTAKKQQSEEEFTKEYQRYELAEGETIQHPLIPPFLAKEGRMVIRVEVRPEQESQTEETSIVKSFEVHLVFEDKEAWKVERIYIPIPSFLLPSSD